MSKNIVRQAQELLFTKKLRIRSRALARDCYDKCYGDVEAAYAMAQERKGELGSVLLMLTIGVMVMQAIYYAMKIWDQMNCTYAPVTPRNGEGFGLAPGEPFELTPPERMALRKAG